MAKNQKKIEVYADWVPSQPPVLVGILLASEARRGAEVFSFSYNKDWLNSPLAQAIDPELELYSGVQYGQNADKNFRVFLDSSPDRWGRLLLKRREALLARQEGRPEKVLLESDYLLGVHDQNRMGGLRFCIDEQGSFLDDNDALAAPPMARLRELEQASSWVEDNSRVDDPEYINWLNMLISPGSSLGGARPKASVKDENNHLWIAKFPSRHDDVDMGAWEYVVYQLALDAGITMAESRLIKFTGQHHTFLTKRFDRRADMSRHHFASAMTLLEYYDGEAGASYLELAEFLSNSGSQPSEDLGQLWRRIVFSIMVSNSDDHLRNHGFLLAESGQSAGWVLSPAYDMNANPQAHGLHLNISDSDNRLDLELALSVCEFFRLTLTQAKQIIQEVENSVSQWRSVAGNVGISRGEQELMKRAFRINC